MSHSMKYFVLKSLILFYLLFSLSNTIHIHGHDDEHVDDCQICIIVQTFFDLPLATANINISYNLFPYLLINYESFTTEILKLKGFYSHAPPLSLFL